ncbi:MAG: Crp/Fnr family transcriptional regulator [Flavobacteriaceae bacterium]|jgi:CRP-like cAMP-binding protein|nr:Crp/Fnr family transcriptional regulator [Flavobacteriaceae bacterium]
MIFEINDHFITETNAETKRYNKGGLIVNEGQTSFFFYYLISGELHVYNDAPEGKEFLQHKVKEKQFFGEPAILLNLPLPGNVKVVSESAKILKIRKEKFLQYLKNHPDWCIEFMKSIAEKSIQKSNALKNIVFLNPEDRIIKQFNDYKEGKNEKTVIKLTRKEVSNMTGLRIETIIRTIKKMEKDGKLEIINGKVYY